MSEQQNNSNVVIIIIACVAGVCLLIALACGGLYFVGISVQRQAEEAILQKVQAVTDEAIEETEQAEKQMGQVGKEIMEQVEKQIDELEKEENAPDESATEDN